MRQNVRNLTRQDRVSRVRGRSQRPSEKVKLRVVGNTPQEEKAPQINQKSTISHSSEFNIGEIIASIESDLSVIDHKVIQCTKKQAQTIRSRLYAINKDGIRQYYTRYFVGNGLMVWQMK